MRNLTASDRSSLIRLAASLPVGDENRRAILAGLSQDLRAFNRQYPYHNDVELVAELLENRRHPVIGKAVNGHRAGLLVRAGLADIVGGPFGDELQLTSKGRRYLAESQEAFADI